MPNIGLEHFHMRQLLSALDISDEAIVDKSETPDFVIRFEDRKVGVELTRFFLPPEQGKKPQQELDALINLAVDVARRRFRSMGGRALYVSLHIGNRGPQNKTEAYDLAERIAFEILCIAHGDRSLEQACRSLYEVDDISIRESVDGNDELWQGGSGGWVAPVQMSDIQEVLDKKAGKYKSCRQVAEEIWLVVVLDIFNCGAPCELEVDAVRERYNTNFDRAMWLNAHAPSVIELARN